MTFDPNQPRHQDGKWMETGAEDENALDPDGPIDDPNDAGARIISSQRYLHEDIVAEKIKLFREQEVNELTLPVYRVGTFEEGFDNLFILADGHHSMAAAEELGISVRFRELSVLESDRAHMRAQEILDHAYMDSDYYDVRTGYSVW